MRKKRWYRHVSISFHFIISSSQILNTLVYSSSRRISRFFRFLNFFYLANEIKDATKKKADGEKHIETIVKIVTKKINSDGRGRGNFRGGIGVG